MLMVSANASCVEDSENRQDMAAPAANAAMGRLLQPSGQAPVIPLVVDLDGALIQSNLGLESIFSHLGQNAFPFGKIVKALWSGKATLKSHIAATTTVDVTELPYDEEVLKVVRDSVARGIPAYLVSRYGERHVRAVAQHLGLFTGWLASTSEADLSQAAKTQLVTDAFGEQGFDYVGSIGDDYPIWAAARKRIATRQSPATRTRLARLDPETVFLKSDVNPARAWAKLLRVHQWAKNALVFVPLMTAHRFDLPALGGALAAFVAFSLAASAVYILNDLVDIEADRKHPTKRSRPLAAGTVPMTAALYAAGTLVLASTTLAFLVAAQFAGVLISYLLLTTAYSFYLKRKMLVDVIALAILYTIRVVGGAAAIGVPLSEWLLVFSILIFTALALTKRYIELAARLDAGLPDPSNRDYRKSDLSVVAALAAGAAFNAVTVFALYISSDTVHHLYRRPDALWLICPILMYWLSRILMLAHRRAMDDDPILFALKDLNSLVAFGLIAEILFIAT